MFDDEHRTAARELLESHLFDRLADDVVDQCAVVHDFAVTDVDAVVREPEPRSDEVRALTGSFTGSKGANRAARLAGIRIVGFGLEAR
jgi:hypothetical protein